MARIYTILAAAVVIGGTALSSMGSAQAQSAIGDRNNITARGQAGTQLALALGSRSTASNNVGGITAGGDLRIGNRNNISTEGRVETQLALALGSRSLATNNVGGISVGLR